MAAKRSRRWKLAKRFLVYLAARAAVGVLSVLPLGLAVALGAALGRVTYVVDGADRRRAIAQLREALGLELGRARQMAGRVFAHVGRVAVELALAPRLGPRLIEYVELPEGERAKLVDALALGRGVIFVSAHLGSWELLAQRIAAAGFDCVTLAKESSNPWLGAWLVARRAAAGVETVNRGAEGGARRMLAALRRGAVLGVLIDQDTKVDSVHVPFFGRPASTPTVAAELALRRGVPVVVGFIRRRADGRGHVVELARVEVAADHGARSPEAVRVLTATLTAHIERAVRASPEEWVWFHARWRR